MSTKEEVLMRRTRFDYETFESDSDGLANAESCDSTHEPEIILLREYFHLPNWDYNINIEEER
jgi:hypothetical protein